MEDQPRGLGDRHLPDQVEVNPYSPPDSNRVARDGARPYASTRMWMTLVASLFASAPIGIAINVALFDMDPLQGQSGALRTACYWAASSVLASLICSSLAAWIIASQVRWYHFWLTYQVGWLAYFSIGVGAVNARVPDMIYSWAPFAIPALVAGVAPIFSSSKKPAIGFVDSRDSNNCVNVLHDSQ